MAREFEVLNANVNLRVNSANAEVKLDEVAGVLEKVTKGSKLTVAEFTKFSQEAAKASSTIKGLNATLSSNGTTFDLTARGAKTWAISVKQGADESAAAITTLSSRFDALNTTALNQSRTFKQVAQDSVSGFRLIANGGNLLVGLRQAYFGTAESTNVFAKALDNLTSGKSNNAFLRFIDFATFGLTQLSDKQKGLVRDSRLVAEQLSNIGIAGTRAANVLKSIAKQEGFAEKADFEGIVSSVKSVTNEFQRLERTIRSGGRPTQQTLDRVQVEARALEKEFELLISQGIIPADTKTRQYLDELLRGMRSGQQAVKVLDEQMKALSNEEEKAAQKAKNLGTAHQSATKAGGGWSFVFNLFRNNQSSITNVDNSVKKLGSSFKQSQQSATVFGSTLAGVLGGNLISNAIFNLSSSISSLPGVLIAAASNAEETANRFRAVFKDTADEAQAFVDNLASDVGRDPFKIQDSLASFQSFNIGLGFSQEKSLEMSQQLQKLSLDFASFNNITDADAQQRFISALSGSSEVLDKYGINIKEAALEQESFRTGLNKSSADLTEQEKTILRLSIIYNSMNSQGAIGDAITTAGSFANQTKRLQANMSLLATEIGTKLLPAIAPFLTILNQLLTVITPRITDAFGLIATSVTGILQPIADSLTAVFNAENTDVALNNLYIVIINALNNILVNINDFTASAFDWGVSFVDQVASGIFDAADSILTDAVNYVGDLIASFLQPGSPPKEGPLSSIDKWGKGLLDTFGDSMTDSDFLKTLEKQLETANTDILTIRQQIIDAERNGYVPPELLQKLKLAEEEKKNIEDQISAQKQLTKQEAKSNKEQAKESSRASSGGVDRSSEERPKREKKTAEQVRTEALAVLDQQLKDGTIKYQDYVEEKLKIEKKFNQDTLEDGKSATQENISNIKNLEKELEDLKEKNKKDKTGKGLQASLDDLQVDKLLGPIIGESESIGTQVGKNFVKSMGSSVSASLQDLSNTVKEDIKIFWNKFGFYIISGIHLALDFEKIKSLQAGQGLVAAILGKVNLLKPVQLLLTPLINLVNNISNSFIGKSITKVLDRLGIFGTLIRKLISLFGRFAGPIGIVVTIWSHWEEIILVWNEAVSFANDLVDDFVNRLGGITKAQGIFDDLFKKANGFFIRIKGIFNTLLKDIGNIDFGAAFKALFEGDFSGAFNILSTGLTNAFGGAFDKLKLLLQNSTFDDILINLIRTAFITVRSVIGEELLKLRDKFVEALPPGFLSLVDEVSLKFFAFQGFITLTLLPALERLRSFFVDNLEPGFNIVKNSFNDFVTTNGPKLTEIGDKLSTTFSLLSDRFSVVSETVSTKLVPPFSRLATTLGLMGDSTDEGGAAGKILKFFGIIAGFTIDLTLDGITHAIDLLIIGLDLLNAGLSKSEPFFNAMVTASTGFYNIIANIANDVSTFVTNIVGEFTKLYNELVGHSIIPDLVTGIMGVLNPFKVDFLGLFSTMITDTIGFFADIGGKIVTSILTSLQGKASTITGAIASLFGGGEAEETQQVDPTQAIQSAGLIQQISNLAVTGISTIQTAFNGFITTVTPLLQSIPLAVKTTFDAVYALLLGEDALLLTLSNDALVVVQSMVNNIVFELGNLNSRASTTVKGFDWKSIGKAIIDGLYTGINENKDKVIQVLKRLAKDAISGAKSELGISSPSIVFREIGVDIIEGFNRGIAAKPPNFKSFVGEAENAFEDVLESVGFENSKARLVIRHASAAFKKNFGKIISLGAKSGGELLTKLLGDSVNLEKAGISGDTGKNLTFTIQQFVEAAINEQKVQTDKFVNNQESLLARVNEQRLEIVEKFRTTLENVRFQTNTTRNQLEDFFKKPITDDKLTELFTQVTEQGITFGDTIDNKIKLAFLSQLKLNGALEDQAAIEEQIRKINEQQAELDKINPPPPPELPITELDTGLKLLESLKLGLDATVPEVLDSLAGLSADMIAELKKALQISSPSRVFMGIGEQVGQGLIEGLLASIKQIPQATNQLTTGLVNGLNIGIPQAALAAGVDGLAVPTTTPNGVIVNVTNNINDKLDLALVERRVTNAIVKSIR